MNSVSLKFLLLILTGVLISACSKHVPEQASGIGPYPQLQGRLIVIEPSRRWQASLQWQSSKPELGDLRLSHAATGTIVEFRWQDELMLLRSNKAPEWRPIEMSELAEQGIVIPPQELAAILLGRMPAKYAATQANTWEDHSDNRFIRVQWLAERHKLTLTDIRHGRVATLIIQP